MIGSLAVDLDGRGEGVRYVLTTAFDMLGLGAPQDGLREAPVRVQYGGGVAPAAAGTVTVQVPAHGVWTSAGSAAPRSATWCWAGDSAELSRDVLHDLWSSLTRSDEPQPQRRRPGGPMCEPSSLTVPPVVEEGVAALGDAIAGAFTRLGLPLVTVAPWPEGRPFAVLLSHDIDQIHDREPWRILADVNHLQKVLRGQERGRAGLAVRRMARATLRPKDPLADFRRILELEGRRNLRSTFFVLDDPYWSRYGARFRLDDRDLARVVGLVRDAGCELGYHGGYYSFNDAAAYARGRERFAQLFGEHPLGIRNHYLRFSYPQTWRAQRAAGFEYDATFGFRHLPGFRAGISKPFMVFDRERQEELDLLELPLTVMDTSLFRFLALDEVGAASVARAVLTEVRRHEGLLTLLWHNNFFNEPEYTDWERVYVRLLDEIEEAGPYVAPAAELSTWWRHRRAVRVETIEHRRGRWRGRVRAPRPLDGLVLRVSAGAATVEADVDGRVVRTTAAGKGVLVPLPPLAAGGAVTVTVSNGGEAV